MLVNHADAERSRLVGIAYPHFFAAHEDAPGIGIVKTLEIIKKERPESAPAIDEVLKTRYWYRCQPCEDCCKKNIFKL